MADEELVGAAGPEAQSSSRQTVLAEPLDWAGSALCWRQAPHEEPAKVTRTAADKITRKTE
jgi:hypothetical protein